MQGPITLRPDEQWLRFMYDPRSMRRFWLLLLLLVLPVQMSWAAVHACEDSITVGGAVLAAIDAPVDLSVDPVDDPSMEESGQAGSSVHACTSLHELMADRVHALLEPATVRLLDLRETAIRLQALPSRPDRPQWPAA